MATFSAKDVGAEEGTVETSWVKNTATTPAPLTPSLSGTATPMDGLSGSASGVQAQPATHAAGNGKLAANATDSAQGKGSGGGQGDAEMDYDVGDENDWGN